MVTKMVVWAAKRAAGSIMIWNAEELLAKNESSFFTLINERVNNSMELSLLLVNCINSDQRFFNFLGFQLVLTYHTAIQCGVC